MVTRNGLVALQHHNSNPSRRFEVGGTEYQAYPQHNVSLVWIPEQYAEIVVNSPQLKTKACNCNNGVMKQIFQYAPEANVNIHETGHP